MNTREKQKFISSMSRWFYRHATGFENRRHHGMVGTKTHNSWWNACRRCHNPNDEHYPNYGGRGIKVCKRWRGVYGFRNFLDDMGERPEGKTLDRINVNGDYEPSNCRWSTHEEQMKNRRKVALLEKFTDEELKKRMRSSWIKTF